MTDDELVGIGADLAPATLVAAYRAGLFPMGLGEHGAPPIGWFRPDPRGVLPLDGLRVSRSLRKACAHYEVRVDTDFTAVVRACADPSRDGRWITEDVVEAYTRLHRLGHAHSVEAWSDGRLVGGLYGVSIGGLFAGESMFHDPERGRDASKAALVHLVGLLRADGDDRRLLDVQWRTDHLATLGVLDVAAEDYAVLLARALQAPAPVLGRGPLQG